MSADVWDFDRLATSAHLHDLEEAVDLHAAELLPGVYDDWALEHRAARRSSFVAALGRIVAAREQAGDLQRALVDARRLIVAEPLNEPAHQTYLRLLGRLYRYAEAIAHFESLQKRLAEELGVAPHPATSEIVDQLTRERDAASGIALEEQTRFVGRAQERSAGLRAVEDVFRGRGAVLCVEGVAGIGKTRLLAEIVSSARWRGAIVLMGDVRAVPEATPLAPLARALAPILTGPRLVHIESVLDPTMLRTLAPLLPGWRGGTARVSRHDRTRASWSWHCGCSAGR